MFVCLFVGEGSLADFFCLWFFLWVFFVWLVGGRALVGWLFGGVAGLFFGGRFWLVGFFVGLLGLFVGFLWLIGFRFDF